MNRITALFNVKSQWANGYEYTQGLTNSQIRTLKTKFLSPAYSQFGIGMFYKKDNNLL